MAALEAPAPNRWNTGNSLTLVTICFAAIMAGLSAVWFLGAWYGKAQTDITEPLKRDQAALVGQLAEARTQLATINTGLPEMAARVRQQALDLGKLEEALRQVERRGDERDTTQERDSNEMRKEVGGIRERLAVIERNSSSPLPGQVRR